MFNFFKPNLAGLNLQDLISQVSPEQATQLRSLIVDTLLDTKSFNLQNPFFVALKNDTAGQFDILKNELIAKIQNLPESHPAKSLTF